MAKHLKIIIDWDGTLTAEETQVAALAEKSLDTLANEIIGAPRETLAADYQATRARLLRAPHRYCWKVNGLVASYCNEGAFILNTTTLQVMLGENPTYAQAVAAAFPQAEYDPVVDCTNYLFHRHTAELPPRFRPAARDVLLALMPPVPPNFGGAKEGVPPNFGGAREGVPPNLGGAREGVPPNFGGPGGQHPDRTPIILTNSLSDKVRRHLGALALDDEITVLGDTRQYDMDPDWTQRFPHPQLGEIQVWPVSEKYRIDLRRPVYYRALIQAAADGSQLAVVADTLSLPGALPLMMGIPFFLLRTPYTPTWCAQAVDAHPLGRVLDNLADLPAALDSLAC